MIQYDRRFIPKSKNMGDYILNGGGNPRKKKVLKRNLNVPQRNFLSSSRGFNKNRFVDHDKDGVISGLDCFPFDKSRHDTWNPLTNKWKPDRKPVPDHVRDSLMHSLDVTRIKGKYSDPARGPSVDTRPLIQELEQKQKMKRQMRLQEMQRRQMEETDRLNKPPEPEEGQLGFPLDQFGV